MIFLFGGGGVLSEKRSLFVLVLLGWLGWGGPVDDNIP